MTLKHAFEYKGFPFTLIRMKPEAKHKNKLEMLEERSRLAEEGGGAKRVEKQRSNGRMTAREREIAAVVSGASEPIQRATMKLAPRPIVQIAP